VNHNIGVHIESKIQVTILLWNYEIDLVNKEIHIEAKMLVS
jgi:hypothetical protein